MPLRIKWPLSIQVQRSARTITNGPGILAEIHDCRAEIVRAAAKGVPPVSAVSDRLKRLFPEEMQTAPARQFVGTAIKALLLDEGFEVHQSGIRLPRDPVFTTGSIYRRASKIDDPAKRAVHDAFARMVKSLTLSEKKALLDVLEKALGVEDDDG